MHSLPHSEAASVLPLRGPLSQILTLQPNQRRQLAFEPKDKRQIEIEVRARVIAAELNLGEIPMVRWSAELGHGDLVWLQPQPALSQIAGTPMLEHSLPGRGMVWRTNSREFRLNLQNAGTVTGGNMPRCDLQISILPGDGMQSPVYPYVHFANPVAGQVQPFPMEAREWKIMDSLGLPFGPAIGTVSFTGVAGGLFGPADWNLYVDWTPIPHDAAGWLPSAAVYAAFR